MVIHDCEHCGLDRAAVIRAQRYVCVYCNEPVDPGAVVTPSAKLTDRDRAALDLSGQEALDETDDDAEDE